jgi:hypothetical protein
MLRFVPCFIFAIAGLVSSVGFSKALTLFQKSPEWTLQLSTTDTLVLQNSSKKQTLFVVNIESTVDTAEFESYLRKSFLKEAQKSHTHELWKFGFQPRSLAVDLVQKNQHLIAKTDYEVPGAEGTSVLTHRFWMGKKGLWHFSIIHEGLTVLQSAEQEKLADAVIEQITRHDDLTAKSTSMLLFDFLFSANSARASEIGQISGHAASNSSSNSETFWRPITEKECAAIPIPAENRQTKLPYKIVAFNSKTIPEQCSRGVARGLVNLTAQVMMVSNFTHAAKVGEMHTAPCGPYPQMEAHESPVDYQARANHWHNCTLGHGLFYTAGDLGRQGWKFARDIEPYATAATNPLAAAAMTATAVAPLAQDPQRALNIALATEQSIAKWFWSKKNPVDGVALFCHELKGLQCLNAEAQTRAMCSCLAGISASLPGTVEAGSAAVSKANALLEWSKALKAGEAAGEAEVLVARTEPLPRKAVVFRSTLVHDASTESTLQLWSSMENHTFQARDEFNEITYLNGSFESKFKGKALYLKTNPRNGKFCVQVIDDKGQVKQIDLDRIKNVKPLAVDDKFRSQVQALLIPENEKEFKQYQPGMKITFPVGNNQNPQLNNFVVLTVRSIRKGPNGEPQLLAVTSAGKELILNPPTHDVYMLPSHGHEPLSDMNIPKVKFSDGQKLQTGYVLGASKDPATNVWSNYILAEDGSIKKITGGYSAMPIDHKVKIAANSPVASDPGKARDFFDVKVESRVYNQGAWGSCHLQATCNLSEVVLGIEHDADAYLVAQQLERTNLAIVELSQNPDAKPPGPVTNWGHYLVEGGQVHSDLSLLSRWPGAVLKDKPVPGQLPVVRDPSTKVAFDSKVIDVLRDLKDKKITAQEAVKKRDELFATYFGKLSTDPTLSASAERIKSAKVTEIWLANQGHASTQPRLTDPRLTAVHIEGNQAKTYVQGIERPTQRKYDLQYEDFSHEIISSLKNNQPLIYKAFLTGDDVPGFAKNLGQGGNFLGGHAMLLTGVRTETVAGKQVIRGFEITNSWGEEVHTGGRFYLPIEQFLQTGGSFVKVEF